MSKNGQSLRRLPVLLTDKLSGFKRILFGLWEFVIFVCWFEVCRTSKLLLGKVLILLVRSRHCGELNRGLQNLEAPCKGNGFILFACTKRTEIGRAHV